MPQPSMIFRLHFLEKVSGQYPGSQSKQPFPPIFPLRQFLGSLLLSLSHSLQSLLKFRPSQREQYTLLLTSEPDMHLNILSFLHCLSWVRQQPLLQVRHILGLTACGSQQFSISVSPKHLASVPRPVSIFPFPQLLQNLFPPSLLQQRQLFGVHPCVVGAVINSIWREIRENLSIFLGFFWKFLKKGRFLD